MIHVHNLTKKYQLYNSNLDRLRESLSIKKKYHQDFYALKNIKLHINKGEVVGILGKNGSGKSTLLKIIAGVLTPTSGYINIQEKVTALLELGAGFNPELSGIDNLYLHGVISSFSKESMDMRVKAILDFADIGEFIYQPVKTYSSGMKARLGFAMAINIDPSIMIIDEALSVGDVAFQRKCYAKIEEMCQNENITVLFVSHSESVIKKLCSRAIILHQGEIAAEGNTKDIVNLYLKMVNSDSVDIHEINKEYNIIEKKSIKENINKKIDKMSSFYSENLITKSLVELPRNGAVISDIKLVTDDNIEVNIIEKNKFYNFSYRVIFLHNFNNARCAVQIVNDIGVQVAGKSIFLKEKNIVNVKKNKLYRIKWRFKNILNEGNYLFNCAVNNTVNGEKTVLHRILDAYLFRVLQEKDDNALCIVDLGFDLSIEDD